MDPLRSIRNGFAHGRCAHSHFYAAWTSRHQSSMIPKALDATRYFTRHFVVPKLHDHQKIVLVPGLFGNSSDSWTEEFLLQKVKRYWSWAQEDARIAGL